MPGVDLESNIPALTDKDIPVPSAAEEAAKSRRAALANANFGPHEQALLDDTNIAGVDLPQQQPVQNVHHHNINLVPHLPAELEAQEDEDSDSDYMDEGQDDDDGEGPPDLDEVYDSSDDESDDETYASEDRDEYESDKELDDTYVDEAEAQEDQPVITRSGRASQRNQDYRDYTFLGQNAGPLHQQVKISVPMPKCGRTTPKLNDESITMLIESMGTDPEEVLIVQEDEIPYLGVIMAQMSLKQGQRGTC